MEEEKKYVFYTLSSEKDVNNIRYIGVTTKKLGARLSQHRYTARKPEKRSTPVAKWIYSLQLKNINVIISKIDECGIDGWEEKERELIEKYKNEFSLLNVDEGDKGVITIEKRNKSGLIRSAEAHEIKIVQLNLKGEYIKTFDSITKATEEMGLNTKSAINNVLRGRSKTSCNSYWIYESDYLNGTYELKIPINLKETRGIKHFQYCPHSHKLINSFLSIGDVFYEITGFSDSNSSGLKKAIENKTTWHGFFWTLEEITDFSEYYNDIYKILEVDLKGKIINKFISNKEAANHFGVAECTISNYIRNKTLIKNKTFLIKNNKEIKI